MTDKYELSRWVILPTAFGIGWFIGNQIGAGGGDSAKILGLVVWAIVSLFVGSALWLSVDSLEARKENAPDTYS